MNNPFKYGSPQRVALAYWLMRWAYRVIERIDRGSVPKISMWTFTFERGKGAVVRKDNRIEHKGCRLVYLNDREYNRAWSESASFGKDEDEDAFLTLDPPDER
ncbi:gp82 [Mycobacterium phage Troll4]|uniref:Uncharacterized protein n=1 Tax=Mycobacterium phage Troll4 TaxID=561999 RepID=B5U448_9CAUD|nr:gp82 [Mycobacterium phage Troll4]ACI06543.1 hypothetical protein TROLL4_82 [Mycobacterium phage Troll4]